MYYAQSYRTKWHDTDADGLMRPSMLVAYMQETANLQLREWGCDVNSLHNDRRMGFLLSRIALRIDEPLHAYEDIEVRTWCPPSRALTFVRCFSVHRNGVTVAEAISHWGLMDLNAGKLVRVSDFPQDYFPTGDMPDESTLPHRVHIPAGTVLGEVGERRIVYSDLDFNRHMNNTKYPDMICDFLPDMSGRRVRSLAMSYLREAAYGDTLTVLRASVSRDGSEGYLLRTVRPDGAVCMEAEVELV